MIFPAPWLDVRVDPARAGVVQWACARVLVVENAGANRSGLIDAWNTALGAPLGSPWCMSFAAAAWRENGVRLLADAACEHWHVQAAIAGRFVQAAGAGIGDIVLFDFGTKIGYADHCGVFVRAEGDWVYTMEGNTNDTGGREGDGVYGHRWSLTDRRILGFVSLDQTPAAS